MKKISSLVLAMLCAAPSFANGPVESASGTSTVAVTNITGSSVFKLYYKSLASGLVKVSIFNSTGTKVFAETITKSSGFARPYNFEGLGEGDYTIQVEDRTGKMVERVSYGSGKIEKLIKVTKVGGEESKYLLTVSSRKSDTIAVKIYDRNGDVLLRESYQVNGEFGQVFNLKKINSFTIEVEDGEGILKSITY